jgi:hypothetical protein
LPDVEKMGSGEKSNCFSYTRETLDADEGGVVKGELSFKATNGLWNWRVDVDGRITLEARREVVDKQRRVQDMTVTRVWLGKRLSVNPF